MTYPIEYHLFFAIFGQNQLLNQYCVWKRIYSGLCPLPPLGIGTCMVFLQTNDA